MALLFLILPSQSEASVITRNYSFKYDGRSYNFTYQFERSDYTYYSSRRRTYDYAKYTQETPGYTLLTDFARALKRKARESGLNEWETVNFIVNFTQSLEYIRETSLPEYPKYPIETLIDKGGDCEDTAILLAGMLDRLGYDAILVSPPRHMAVGLVCEGIRGTHYEHQDKKYYYIETTGENWKIGQLPDDYKGTATLYTLNSSGYKGALAYEGESGGIDRTSPGSTDPDRDDLLQVVFTRSTSGSQRTYRNRSAYRFSIELVASDKKMHEISRVYYRRMHKTFPEYQNNTWIVRNNRDGNFRSSWTGWGYSPVTIMVEYENGEKEEYYFQGDPKIHAGN